MHLIFIGSTKTLKATSTRLLVHELLSTLNPHSEEMPTKLVTIKHHISKICAIYKSNVKISEFSIELLELCMQVQ